MHRKRTHTFKNQLALARQKRSIDQKQVAKLLGLKGIDQISRLERGVKLPSLKTALKLGIIYKIPIRILLDGYFEACWDELKRQEKQFSSSGISKVEYDAADLEFCSIDEKLKSAEITPDDLANAYRHSAELIRRRAEKLDHISTN